jgi:hypothetical protein
VAAEINKQAQPANIIAAGAKPFTAQIKTRAEKIQPPEPTVIAEESGLLVVISTEETWLRIKTDQNPPFQVLLKPGEKIERQGTSFDLDIGNAAGIKMNFKGKIIENLGKPGQVIHLRLP